uniref:Annexin n=1 Tax=Plectus sambesii TaxID=2011161 RepID=A0A914VP02_9BILA
MALLLHLFDNKGTVKGPNSKEFDPEAASEKLHKAFKGLGTDEKQLIEVIGEHTNWQRQEIKKKYKQMFGRDLLNDLEDELGGHFLDLTLA